jgi:hypothetical protein
MSASGAGFIYGTMALDNAYSANNSHAKVKYDPKTGNVIEVYAYGEESSIKWEDQDDVEGFLAATMYRNLGEEQNGIKGIAYLIADMYCDQDSRIDMSYLKNDSEDNMFKKFE